MNKLTSIQLPHTNVFSGSNIIAGAKTEWKDTLLNKVEVFISSKFEFPIALGLFPSFHNNAAFGWWSVSNVDNTW